MKEHLHSFMEKYAYPVEAQKQILADYEKVRQDDRFAHLVERFYEEPAQSAEELLEVLDGISGCTGVNRYTLHLIFFLCLTKGLQKAYEKAGLDESIYEETVADLLYKLMECYEVEKVWGITTFGWHNNMFRMKILAFGRMQYCFGKFGEPDAVVAERTIGPEDTVVYIHIPSSNKPFDRESRIASYEKAYFFFRDSFADKVPIFCCDTWLLNPENRAVLGEKSNIVSFIDDFKIIKTYKYTDNRNMWRIFGAEADKAPKDLPRNTSMQRKIADWLQEGNRLGAGKGLFIYDPVNRTTIK